MGGEGGMQCNCLTLYTVLHNPHVQLNLAILNAVNYQRAITGIPHCNQRWTPEKQKKRADLALSFYKATGLTQAKYFKSHSFLIQ